MSALEVFAHKGFTGVVHPLADKYPRMDNERLDELSLDIFENGQREAIWLDVDGNLIDGRNRLAACLMCGIEPLFDIYDGDDIEAFIVSKNEHRRDLTQAQRADIRRQRAAELEAQGLSKRAIAKELGVSDTQVRADLAQVQSHFAPAKPAEEDAAPSDFQPVEPDPAPEPPRVKGRDGKSYPATKPKKEPAKGVDRSPAAKAARVATIRTMAGEGHSSRQIATATGVAERQVRELARENDITIPADEVLRNLHHPESNRIVEGIVSGSEVSETAMGLIDYTALDVAQVERWVSSLTESIRSLTTIKKKLKELTQ